MQFVKKYFNVLLTILMWIIVFGIPALLVKLNPPPAEAELAHFHAKILRVSEAPPNLVVETANGEHLRLRFPISLYALFGSKTDFLGLSAQQELHLSGCDAEIYGSNIRYLWPAVFQVWKIDCAAAPIGYSQIVAKYTSMNSDFETKPWFGLLVMTGIFILTFIQARKEK